MTLPDLTNKEAGQIEAQVQGEKITDLTFSNESVEIYTNNHFICVCLIDNELDLEVRRIER